MAYVDLLDSAEGDRLDAAPAGLPEEPTPIVVDPDRLVIVVRPDDVAL